MAERNLGDLGADRDATNALDLILRYGSRDPNDEVVRLAIDYLHVVIPPNSHARALLLIITDNLDSYRRGLWSGPSGITDFGPVADALHLLRQRMDTEGLPRITRPRSAAELDQLAQRLGVRGDWHEPDEQGVYATTITKPGLAVTAGGFDNAGHSVLEQTVVIFQEHQPVAEVSLATLFAWACDAGRRDPTPPAIKAAAAAEVDTVDTSEAAA